MTYIVPREIQKVDEQNTDDFNRMRTASPFTMVEYKQTRNKNSLQISETITGSATSVYQPADAGVLMSVTGNGDSVIRQTLSVYTYQNGKAGEFLSTLVPDPGGTNGTGVSVKAGIYDASNGIFFEYLDGVFYAVVRKDGTDTKIAQGSWNGTMPPNAMDPTKSQLFKFTFTWLSLGDVKFWVYQGGEFYNVHTQNHANIIVGAYASNMNAPIRYEISSTSGSGSLLSICAVAESNGGYLPASLLFSAGRGTNARSISSGITSPVLSIRYKSTGSLQNSRVELKDFSVITTDGSNFLLTIWFCPPSQGTLTTPTWVSSATDSAIEYDISSTTFTNTNCVPIYRAYASDTNDLRRFTKSDLHIGVDNAGNSAKYVLTVTNLTGNNVDYYASLNWSEYF